MKHLSAMGVFRESGQDTYVATKLSQTLSLAKYAGGFPCMYDLYFFVLLYTVTDSCQGGWSHASDLQVA